MYPATRLHRELEALIIDPADGITWESDQLNPPPAERGGQLVILAVRKDRTRRAAAFLRRSRLR